MSNTKKTDTPKVHASLAKLRKEARAAAEPFQIALHDNKIVTFDDPFSQDAERAERIFYGLQNGTTRPSAAIRDWLSEEDADVLFSQGLTMRDLTLIVEAAMSHFEQTYGPQGEDGASRR